MESSNNGDTVMCDNVDGMKKTDCAILKVFHIEDRPLWEELIYDCIQKHHSDLPVNGGVTVQVVERRVQVLEDDDYLESVIASPDPMAREMIAAYILAEKGEQLF